MAPTPPPTKQALVTFPAPHVMLVTLNRPKALNCISLEQSWELDAVWNWYDAEPELRVAIVTGSGRAFCAGADLKEAQKQGLSAPGQQGAWPEGGFGGLSRRNGRKPVIAAVNGLCFGGGTEMAVNCDIVIASANALFGLPEVKRGVSAQAGALPRITRSLGLQRASEMALFGRNITPAQAKEWGFVNHIAEEGKVVEVALQWAAEVVENSPDSIIATRAGVRGGWEAGSVEDAVRIYAERELPRLSSSENMAEGLKAFVEKRKPVWKPAKL